MAYMIKCESDTGSNLYLQERHVNEKTIYMWCGNISHEKNIKFENYHDACDMLLYIDNLQIMGKMPVSECNDIVDENGNEVIF